MQLGDAAANLTYWSWLERFHAEIVDASILWHDVFEEFQCLSR